MGTFPVNWSYKCGCSTRKRFTSSPFALLQPFSTGLCMIRLLHAFAWSTFTIGHPPVFATDDPTLLGLGWGVIASWWVGLLLGIPLALVARAGGRSKVFVLGPATPDCNVTCDYGRMRDCLRPGGVGASKRWSGVPCEAVGWSPQQSPYAVHRGLVGTFDQLSCRIRRRHCAHDKGLADSTVVGSQILRVIIDEEGGFQWRGTHASRLVWGRPPYFWPRRRRVLGRHHRIRLSIRSRMPSTAECSFSATRNRVEGTGRSVRQQSRRLDRSVFVGPAQLRRSARRSAHQTRPGVFTHG